MSKEDSLPPGPISPTIPPGLICDPERFMLVGSMGGAMIGFFTGFFHPSRIPMPHSPLPLSASRKAHGHAELMITSSAIGWRIFKRMMVGSFLYPIVVCQLQGKRKSPTVFQCGVAGAVCGGIFGLRGGPSGMTNGAFTFFIFASLVEGYKQWRGI